jgi:hypothetical protein
VVDATELVVDGWRIHESSREKYHLLLKDVFYGYDVDTVKKSALAKADCRFVDKAWMDRAKKEGVMWIRVTERTADKPTLKNGAY